MNRTHSSFAIEQRLSGSHRYAFIFASTIILALLALSCLLFPAPSAQAKVSGQSVYRGLVVQVDRTNITDVTFSLLDPQGASQTFHLSARTRFSQHYSASQLAVNDFVIVNARPDTAWGLDALQVQLQRRNQSPFDLQAIVASVDSGQKSLTLALSDGTMLAITIEHANLTHTQPGALIFLNARFTAGSLVASTFRTTTSHVRHFTARGIISNINARTHNITLATPSGTTFSIAQPHSSSSSISSTGSLRIGEMVAFSGSTDSQGNLDAQNTSVVNTAEQQLILRGIVTAIDTTAGAFTLLDMQGNDSTLKADPSLLSSIQVNGIYEVEATIASDGSLTATQILAKLGNAHSSTITLEGIVQTYDTSSGLLSFAGENGQSFTLLVSSQTVITTNDGTPATLASGQAIHATVQLNSDGSYTVLAIKIEDNSGHQGQKLTFSGALQSYDATSGQITITTTSNQTLSFQSTSDTVVMGADSLSAIPSGTVIYIQAQVQQDGSYLALKVGVRKDGHGGDKKSFGGTLENYDASTGQLTISAEGQTLSFLTTSATVVMGADSLSAIPSGTVISILAQVQQDGSYLALKIGVSESHGGEKKTFGGTLQSYDATSGQITITTTTSGQTLSFQTTSTTEVMGADSLAAIPVGTFIYIQAQAQQDDSYLALKVGVPKDGHGGEKKTCSGTFQSYDVNTGQLTISTESQTISFQTSSATEVLGATSLASIPGGTFIYIQAQVQQDGSYLALKVGVPYSHSEH